MFARSLAKLVSARYFSLTREQVESAVLQQVQRIPKLASVQVTPVSTLKSLGLDSLDTVEVVTALEEKLGVALNDAEVKKLTSMPEITTAFYIRLSEKGSTK